jgi:hypothetical protein
MTQHVGMDSEGHLGGRPEPRHHAAKGNRRHWRAALAHEDISSGFLFALETAQGAKLDAGQWMDGRYPILKPMDVQVGPDPITRQKVAKRQRRKRLQNLRGSSLSPVFHQRRGTTA